MCEVEFFWEVFFEKCTTTMFMVLSRIHLPGCQMVDLEDIDLLVQVVKVLLSFKIENL